MGKKQHSKDKLFVTTSEWKNEWGGKKRNTLETVPIRFQFNNFNECSLTNSTIEEPVCTFNGRVYELEAITNFIKKHGKDPFSSSPLNLEDLIHLRYFASDDGKVQCPILRKIFNEHTHIVAVRTSGHVFSYEAIEKLCLKTNNRKCPMTGATFSLEDIIHIQNPSNRVFHQVKSSSAETKKKFAEDYRKETKEKNTIPARSSSQLKNESHSIRTCSSGTKRKWFSNPAPEPDQRLKNVEEESTPIIGKYLRKKRK